jgi:uncharacterized membrane protein
MKELTLSKRQKNITFATVFTLAGVVYCLISLVNHYLFKTYALDLGLYTHALYDYAHFRAADCSMFKVVEQNLLSDHFDLYLIILSPLIYLFGTYTLLIVQIVSVLLGGWGVYKLIGLYTDDDWMPLLASAVFLFSFGVIQPFSFDYHSNVVTAMLLPWLLYFIKQGRYGLASLFVVLFVIGKENMSLWLFFIVTALMWDYRKEKKTLWHLVAYAFFSLVYFFIINMIVMPKLGGAGGGFARYAHLGENYADIAKTLLLNPGETVRLLFTNTTPWPRFDGIKTEFYLCVLFTGLLLILLKPNFLLMIVPLIAQKMLSIDPTFWGVSSQYSVEFMPILVISSFLVIIKLKNRVMRMVLAVALLVSTILTTFYTLGTPKSKVLHDHVCVYQGQHYVQNQFDSRYARELIKQIPDEATVSAASMFVPHLALRDDIYDLDSRPNPHADYVLITQDCFDKMVHWKKAFPDRDAYETVATDGTIYLLRRKQP